MKRKKESVSILKSFGRNIRQVRTMMDLSQFDLAKKAGIHWTYIGGIEQGRRNPTLLTIHKLARAFDVPAWMLLSLRQPISRRVMRAVHHRKDS